MVHMCNNQRLGKEGNKMQCDMFLSIRFCKVTYFRLKGFNHWSDVHLLNHASRNVQVVSTFLRGNISSLQLCNEFVD